MTINSTIQTGFSKIAGSLARGNDKRPAQELVKIEPSLAEPINYTYGIPLKLTTETAKYENLRPIGVKALANTSADEILGIILLDNRQAEKFIKAGSVVSVVKGNTAYEVMNVLITTGETITAGDELEFVPASNTYKRKTTGTAIFKALENGAGGDILSAQLLIA
jgi:hypothetical protein